MAVIITPETAADAPQTLDPDADPTPAPNARVEALWAALTANPAEPPS
ncbi:hypothetical protein HS048_29830 [Planomonospora sp. ID91781]|nr:hypothetical protein [Planomonospora sp. ID91781]MBG0824902.1 hypothetical protein [Planomonospora sp. ID91781]